VILVAQVDCEVCGETYQGNWDVEADTIEDVDEAPTESQECPNCGEFQVETYPGWVNRTEAGL
jgi:hypothetical protein